MTKAALDPVLLPAASYAVAESIADPLAIDVVFHKRVKGAVDDEPILVKP